ncbi:hypothetical protein QQF64_019091 [Cirrhinus molitorella]|uniref:Uncharacterized protein n=1 Tax=Cirrhinus molitorella TaxID=172907 RepID=A0ABR3LFW7_9TELE
MQFISARSSLECLFDSASDSRALPQTKGGKRQVRPVVRNRTTHREMLSEIVWPGGPAKTEVEISSKKKKEGEKVRPGSRYPTKRKRSQALARTVVKALELSRGLTDKRSFE